MCIMLSSAQGMALGGPRVCFGTPLLRRQTSQHSLGIGHLSSGWHSLLCLEAACAGLQARFFSCGIVMGILLWSNRLNTNLPHDPQTVDLGCLSLGCFKSPIPIINYSTSSPTQTPGNH